MQQTKTLKLNIIEGSDTVDPAPINQNMEALEAETQAIRTDFAAADSALRTDFTAADTSMAAQISALAANLGSGGKNARLACGTYTGTGTLGIENAIRLTVDFYPVFLVVADSSRIASGNDLLTIFRGGYSALMYWSATGDGFYKVNVTWEDRGVSWYSEQYKDIQHNSEEVTYYYCLIGYDDT